MTQVYQTSDHKILSQVCRVRDAAANVPQERGDHLRHDGGLLQLRRDDRPDLRGLALQRRRLHLAFRSLRWTLPFHRLVLQGQVM